MAPPVEHLPTVAVVGLGKMGAAIAERILLAGYPLAVHNRTRAKAEPFLAHGATPIERPGDALPDADVCVTMLADDDALASTACGVDGILAGARAGTALIDMSTVSVAASAQIAADAEQAGVRYLRAPVSGNPGVVRAGALTVIVSGPEDTLRELDGLLRAIGPNVYHAGDGEQARFVKLGIQVLLGGTAELLAEAAGVERATFLEIVGASAIGSPFVKYKTEPLLHDDYSATFTTAMMLKDVDLVLALAGDLGVALPVARDLRGLLDAAVESGYADIDFMALYLHARKTTEKG